VALEVLNGLLLLLLLSGGLSVQLVLWPLYVRTRDERDAVIRDRDGWRDVAQRALVVAQLSRSVTRRATKLTRTAQ
jgi:hypothetical protein